LTNKKNERTMDMESVLGWGTPAGLAIIIVAIGTFILLVSIASKFSRK
jgi:hypothetical protein